MRKIVKMFIVGFFFMAVWIFALAGSITIPTKTVIIDDSMTAFDKANNINTTEDIITKGIAVKRAEYKRLVRDDFNKEVTRIMQLDDSKIIIATKLLQDVK